MTPRGQTPERKAYMKAWSEANPPRDRRAYKKAYDEAHKVESKAYRDENETKLKEQKKAYYEKNREYILGNVKNYGAKNRQRISDYQAQYYEANSERIKTRVADYQKANPEKKIHLENKRRASKFNNGGSHTLKERLEKFAALGNVCFYCNQSAKLTVDHNIPLSRGGTDNIDNILPCCRSCNSKKNALTTAEYLLKISRTNHAQVGGVGDKPAPKYEGR